MLFWNLLQTFQKSCFSRRSWLFWFFFPEPVSEVTQAWLSHLHMSDGSDSRNLEKKLIWILAGRTTKKASQTEHTGKCFTIPLFLSVSTNPYSHCASISPSSNLFIFCFPVWSSQYESCNEAYQDIPFLVDKRRKSKFLSLIQRLGTNVSIGVRVTSKAKVHPLKGMQGMILSQWDSRSFLYIFIQGHRRCCFGWSFTRKDLDCQGFGDCSISCHFLKSREMSWCQMHDGNFVTLWYVIWYCGDTVNSQVGNFWLPSDLGDSYNRNLRLPATGSVLETTLGEQYGGIFPSVLSLIPVYFPNSFEPPEGYR